MMPAKKIRFLTACSLLAALSLLLASCSVSLPLFQEVAPRVYPMVTPGDYVKTVVSGGQPREYRLHIPPGYQPTRPVPLVLNFHGYTSNAAAQEQDSLMSVKADTESFIAVHPQGLGNPTMWDNRQSSYDVRFVRDLIAQLQPELNIDPRRIYATGMSMGGGMTNRLGCDMADVFAAMAPVDGAYAFSADCRPARPIPVVAFHGTGDTVVPYTGNPAPGNPWYDWPSIHTWAADWAKRNGCKPDASASQQQKVKVETWGGCRGGAEVTLYTIEDWPHSWPGGALLSGAGELRSGMRDATDVIWEFFARHPKP